jgi:hypothetical protein
MARKPNQHIKYRAVPEVLKEMRAGADLTQRELALKISRPYWYIARAETGSRRIDVTEWMEWCGGCGIDPKDALDLLRAKS